MMEVLCWWSQVMSITTLTPAKWQQNSRNYLSLIWSPSLEYLVPMILVDFLTENYLRIYEWYQDAVALIGILSSWVCLNLWGVGVSQNRKILSDGIVVIVNDYIQIYPPFFSFLGTYITYFLVFATLHHWLTTKCPLDNFQLSLGDTATFWPLRFRQETPTPNFWDPYFGETGCRGAGSGEAGSGVAGWGKTTCRVTAGGAPEVVIVAAGLLDATRSLTVEEYTVKKLLHPVDTTFLESVRDG